MFSEIVDGSFGSLDEALAFLGTTREEWEAFQQYRAGKLLSRRAITPKLLNEALEEYLAEEGYVGLGHSPETSVAYRTSLGLWLKFFCSRLSAITTDRVSIEHLQEFLLTSRSHSTWNKRVTVIRAFFEWCETRGYVEENPLKNRQIRYKRPETPTRAAVLTFKQARQLAEVAKESRYGLRNHTLVTLFLESGARLREALRLRERDINFRSKTLHYVGKGNKDRWVPLTEHLYRVLMEYVEQLKWIRRMLGVRVEHSDFLFYSHEGKRRGQPLGPRGVQDMVQRCLSKLDLPMDKNTVRITIHKLRHTYAVQQLLNGISLPELQRRLGHNSVDTTMVYLMALSDEEVRNYMNRVRTIELSADIRRRVMRVAADGYEAIGRLDDD